MVFVVLVAVAVHSDETSGDCEGSDDDNDRYRDGERMDRHSTTNAVGAGNWNR